MNKKELKLAVQLLEDHSDMISGHSCNDVDESFWKGWSKKDRKKFVLEYHTWNKSLKDYEEDPDNLYLFDWQIASFLSYKLSKVKIQENE